MNKKQRKAKNRTCKANKPTPINHYATMLERPTPDLQKYKTQKIKNKKPCSCSYYVSTTDRTKVQILGKNSKDENIEVFQYDRKNTVLSFDDDPDEEDLQF